MSFSRMFNLLKEKEDGKIKVFLRDKLKLELNSKTQIFKNTKGVNFCGYKINEYRQETSTLKLYQYNLILQQDIL